MTQTVTFLCIRIYSLFPCAWVASSFWLSRVPLNVMGIITVTLVAVPRDRAKSLMLFSMAVLVKLGPMPEPSGSVTKALKPFTITLDQYFHFYFPLFVGSSCMINSFTHSFEILLGLFKCRLCLRHKQCHAYLCKCKWVSC